MVEVRNGETTSTRLLRDDLKMARAAVPTTVEDVFAALRRAQRDADEVEATYHSDFGYPREVHVDEISQAIDDEHQYRILSLVALSKSSR